MMWEAPTEKERDEAELDFHCAGWKAAVRSRDIRITELEAALEAKHQQYTGAVIQLTEARTHSEQYRQNWLALQAATGEDCQLRALEVISEARNERERLSELYELADVFRPGSIVIQLPLPTQAQWDGVTCLWTREIFNAAIDNAIAARGAK
jgi:hypothetical protein